MDAKYRNDRGAACRCASGGAGAETGAYACSYAGEAWNGAGYGGAETCSEAEGARAREGKSR